MSTKGKEYKLAIRIAGIIDKSFTASLATANTALKRNIVALDKNFVTLDKGFDKIVNVGQACFSAIATAAGVATLAIGAAMAASIAVGTEFESAFAGVKKTVDATADEYEWLRQDILDMTREIPSSASEIASVMEIAGQLGIAKEALTDFTETMINLGVSTTVSAEEASESLAKFANIMTMKNYGEDGISNFERLGSTIVDLGNNFATTEGDIIAIATALAASGKMADMSEADIMGISAAMSSVGLTAEAGASSMSRLIMQMQMAVAEGGEAMSLYTKTAGMTGTEFEVLFKNDAAEAVTAFIAGLNKAGEDSYGILEDLELSTIRTRKAFLSLAGADELMSNAIDMANEAWEENTALAIEAGKRYETMESRLQIMKNAFAELGITAYEELRGPLVDTIDDITESVWEFNEYIGGTNGVSEWIEDIGMELPTLQRKFSKFADPVFEGIIDVGKWVMKNGKEIISVLAGIGSALALYKTVSTISHIAAALITLQPATLVIIGVVAALSALVAAFTSYKLNEQEMIDNNLINHFGNIALSMEEIQAVAEHIVGSESLESVKKALEAFEDLDGISATMEDIISEIEKMNWKVSIGMELTPDEQETYQKTIEEYVQSAMQYAQDTQYAVSLNLATGLSDVDLGSQNVVDKINQFYQDKYDELAALGTQLKDTITDAFNDGLLEIEETEVIVDIQAKMGEIEKSLAVSEYEAELSFMQQQLSGGNLTAETFQNVQKELAVQEEAMEQTFHEAYVKNYSSSLAAYKAGYISNEEFKSVQSEYYKEYLQNVSDTRMKSINFQIETIMNQYAEELKPVIKDSIANVKQVISTYEDYEWEGSYNAFIPALRDAYTSEDLSEDTRDAIQTLLDAMTPSLESMEELRQKYEALGVDMSEAMVEGFYSYDMLSALTEFAGTDGFYVAGYEMAEAGLWDTFYNEFYKTAEAAGRTDMYGFVKEGAADAAAQVSAEEISAAAEVVVRPAVEGMYAWSQESIDAYYSQGFSTEADVNITLNPIFDVLSGNKSIFDNLPGLTSLYNFPVNQRAEGGLATKPELTWFAEKGPEMAIPIDGSQNAISLWEQTGQLLGVKSVPESKEKYPTTAYSSELNKNLYQYKSLAFNSVRSIPINQRAEGGLATKPELTWFAEKSPEMAIPIDGSRNAISLWLQTGELLGMETVFDNSKSYSIAGRESELNNNLYQNKNLHQYRASSFSFTRSIPINQRAEGGLATKPELTWFAEKSPEMAIPIDGSQNAISLWEQTGQLLGMESVLDNLELESSSSPSIEYSPTLQFYGGTPSKEDLTDALRISQDEFDDLMERYFRTHARVSFG